MLIKVVFDKYYEFDHMDLISEKDVTKELIFIQSGVIYICNVSDRQYAHLQNVESDTMLDEMVDIEDGGGMIAMFNKEKLVG
ncbi:hypothetical protein [Aeromonas phage 65.2]|uniref:Uncharacterized protein n=1 Tax=Aeromonas phage 65.2 TaxID=1932896 RepID=A0A219YCV7_9CAUD|nr:hypothetical protein [Aeromonas phage 65.2]